MAGLNTINTKLHQKEGVATEFTEIEDLLEVGELGGTPEKIDVTTLSDTVKKSINGVKDLGDLTFKFLYDNSTTTSNYRVLKDFETNKKVATYQVEYPDGTTHEFDAEVSVKMDSVAVNGSLTFTATMAMQSEITVTNPV